MDKRFAQSLSGLASEFTDCCIIVGSKKFPCHKIILAAASEFFKLMLLSNFKESISGEIYLENVTPDIFEKFFKYIYDCTELSLYDYDDDTLIELYVCGKKWLVRSIEEDCKIILFQRTAEMNIESVVNLFELAHKYEDKIFIQFVTNILKPITPFVMQCERVLRLDPHVFMQYITNAALRASEIERYNLIIRYIQFTGLPNNSGNDGNNKLNSNDVKPNQKVENKFSNEIAKQIMENDTTKSKIKIKEQEPIGINSLHETLNFEEMSSLEFYTGPGKSDLLTYKMKYEIMYKICENQKNDESQTDDYDD